MTLNLLFCGNYKVFDGILTAVLSALMRTPQENAFCVHVFTMDASHLGRDYLPVTQAQMETLQQVLQSYNSGSTVLLHDVSELYRQEFSGCPNEGAYCSPYTLIRLLADKVPGMPDKFLYLDADILFNRSVRLLYDTDLTGFEYAAAPDHYGKYLIHPHYINAGVLLINLKEMNRTGLLERAREILRQKKLVFADQSALIRATDQKKILPQRFNDQKFLHGHTVIRHFSKRLFWLPYPHTENIKQWQVQRVHEVFKYHQFDDILSEYLQLKAKL